MIRNEYVRFMQTLSAPSATDDVRKLANLFLDKLDIIQPLGTSQGQRVKKITQLAQVDWKTLPIDITVETASAIDNTPPISRLTNLSVGPFRGFAREEKFNLNSSLVLIYGPNGTGKSSFCEALEYGLLGNVSEAEAKRFRSQDEYFKNAHTGKFTKPVIEAINAEGITQKVVANESIYRFCFVEKNRIDNFSRIAAHSPARQTELISSLFGLDKFNDFVRGFSADIDARYIDLVGVNKKRLQEKQQTLLGQKQTIENNTKELVELVVRETKLAQSQNMQVTFSEMISSLGTVEAPGKISELENELQKVLPSKTGLTLQELLDLYEAIKCSDRGLTLKSLELSKASEGLSFKRLYTAIQSLQVNNQNYCPACKTPLEIVTSDPFKLAAQELEKLAHLTQMENEYDQYEASRRKGVESVQRILQVACKSYDNMNDSEVLEAFLVPEGTQVSWEWWVSLHVDNGEAKTGWQALKDRVLSLESRDAQIHAELLERDPKQQELNALRQVAQQVLVLQTQRKGLEEGIQNANAAILEFDEENESLISAVEDEVSTVQQNQEISAAYAKITTLLSAYKDQLPNQLVADLGDNVVELYNSFNRFDSDQDLIASIKLPVASGQRIEISFQNNPGRYFDALHILSEGHIRCVGLAILLAKNIRENCPVLVFDDPVNAIDEEHRKAIRMTLFKDKFFNSTQIIIACHGNEFFKDTHQIIGKEIAKKSESYIFCSQTEEKHIQVSSLSRPINYVLAASTLNDQGELRDALMSARRALEELCPRIWAYYNKHGGGPISLLQRAPNAPIDLRSLAEKLALEMEKAKFEIKNRELIATSLRTILGPNGQHPHWVCLNKGTHEEEDRDEFEKTVVTEIVEALLVLDKSTA
ncbi:AAA family ATPase [Pseudomonas helleri]|uniref:AAA family ATPase n=1 Tax=Pseudomonas helleri TaxID=1608996 RepID=A0A7X2CFD3_9PSED|nr:AAA family ATPase [Pseudomonas helleri]MQU29074.1 AAA family ATPase [Pseudomonas helleri]